MDREALIKNAMLADMKAGGDTGDADDSDVMHLLGLWVAGSMDCLESIRFKGAEYSLSTDLLSVMHSGSSYRVDKYLKDFKSVAASHGVPDSAATIFAEDMTALVLGGDMRGWRHSTTRDVFKHLHSAYRPKVYLSGTDLHNKCTDSKYVMGMLHTLNELISFGSRRA